jgi:hypothetical protein
VAPDGGATDPEEGRDLGRREPVGDRLEDFDLAWGEKEESVEHLWPVV